MLPAKSLKNVHSAILACLFGSPVHTWTRGTSVLSDSISGIILYSTLTLEVVVTGREILQNFA